MATSLTFLDAAQGSCFGFAPPRPAELWCIGTAGNKEKSKYFQKQLLRLPATCSIDKASRFHAKDTIGQQSLCRTPQLFTSFAPQAFMFTDNRCLCPFLLFPSCPQAARAEPATSTSSMWLRAPTRSLPCVSNPSLTSPKRGTTARPSIWGRLNPNRGSWAPSLGPSSHLAANSPWLLSAFNPTLLSQA